MPLTTGLPHASAEGLFVQSLPAIDRIVRVIARRNALDAAEAAEFDAWAKARLIADDYAILRKFGGRSSLTTYLSVVLSNLYRDHRNSLWGRWRPSAAAERLGPIGVRLEELLTRDRCSLRVAIGILMSRSSELSHGHLVRMAAELPNRPPEEHVPIDRVEDSIPGVEAESGLTADERALVSSAVEKAVAELPAEDAVITRMRFWDNVSVADIARALRLDQKRLYRRLESIHRQLRAALVLQGMTEERVRDLLHES